MLIAYHKNVHRYVAIDIAKYSGPNYNPSLKGQKITVSFFVKRQNFISSIPYRICEKWFHHVYALVVSTLEGKSLSILLLYWGTLREALTVLQEAWTRSWLYKDLKCSRKNPPRKNVLRFLWTATCLCRAHYDPCCCFLWRYWYAFFLFIWYF